MFVLLIGAGSTGIGREPPGFFDAIQKSDVALLKRYLRVQVGVASTVCDLSQEQTNELSKLNADWIAEAYKAETGKHKKPLIGRLKRDGKKQNFFGVESAIDEAIRELLTENQRREFDREVESRHAFRCQATANALVASMDSRLFLSRVQRIGLAEEIVNWMKKSDVQPAWQFYFQSSDVLPNIPKSVFENVLTEEQMNIVNASNMFHVDGKDLLRQFAR